MRLLAPSERQILELLAQGKRKYGIAAALHISPYTVRTQIGAIQRKLGIDSLHGLVAWAYRSGWVDRDPGPALAWLSRKV